MALQLVRAACSTACAVFCCPCLRDRSFPANVEAISAGWLTTALRKEGVLPPSSTVTSVTFTRIGDSEKGMSSDLAFLALEIEGDAGSCPSKMVAKFPLPSFEKRAGNNEMKGFGKEAHTHKGGLAGRRMRGRRALLLLCPVRLRVFIH